VLADEQLLPLPLGEGRGEGAGWLGSVLWPLADHLGTVHDIVTHDSVNGTVPANHRVFDSYGILTSQSNANFQIVFGFTGVYFDTTTTFSYHRNRWYDPHTGRWLSEDPIGIRGGDTNFQRYVGNDPINVIDPTGLRGSGHHIVPWSIFNGKVSQEVHDFFDSDEARIFNDFYTDHNGKTLNEVSHPKYTRLLREELEKFLGKKKLSDMTPGDAKRFLEHIKSKGGDIGNYLKGVRKEAADALKKGLDKIAKKGVGRAGKSAESTLKRLLRKGKGALPLCSGLIVTGFFLPGQIEAKGLGGAAVDEALDSVPILEWIKTLSEIITGEDWIPARGENGMFDQLDKKYGPTPNLGDFPPF
jgi:RHS repeat-associated protein